MNPTTAFIITVVLWAIVLLAIRILIPKILGDTD